MSGTIQHSSIGREPASTARGTLDAVTDSKTQEDRVGSGGPVVRLTGD